jgi:ubiquinone/menaquinone biosynthesis C-methylase UbiE
MDERKLVRYNTFEGADSYSRKFHKKLSERVNNRNEQRLLRRLLKGIAAEDSRLGEGLALDLPCGCGRLFPLVSEFVGRVVEGDWGLDMLRIARQTQLAPGEGVAAVPALGYVRATALQMPFGSNRFDLVVSVRLCHHIREHHERLQYLRELLRISRRWVVFTYFDFHSLKNRWRELRRRFSHKRSKWTLRTAEVRGVGEEMGFELRRSVPLSRLFSGHRYAVLRRRD